jgi:putative ABC transport system permease protein
MYLLGTAVSIALAMILFIIFYIKLGPIYPEYNRHRMLIVKDTKETVVNEISTTTMSSDISSKFASLIKKECSAVEEIALATISKNVIVAGNSFIDNEWGYEVNSEFWKVFNFKFIDGHPFTEDDKNNNVIIISRDFAQRLFARENVVGETVNVGNVPCRVIGVVE